MTHNRVHGQLADPLRAGSQLAYDANDPELLLWVAATLMDSAVIAYEQFIEPLSSDEKDQFLREAKRIWSLFGISASLYPDNWPAFEVYMAHMLNNHTLIVTPTARQIYWNLLTGTWFVRLLSPFNYAIAAMLLPQRLAGEFGLKRSIWVRGLFSVMVGCTRLLVRLIPRSLRGVPAARRREQHYRQE